MKRNLFTISIMSLIILPVLSCGPTISYSVRDTYTEDGVVARFGHIRLDGITIPPVFTLVIAANGTTFRFFQLTGPVGRAGYHPVQPVPVTASLVRITREDLDQGWYEGRSRLSKTPDTWIFVAWPGGSAFVSPRELERLVKEKGLAPMPISKKQEVLI